MATKSREELYELFYTGKKPSANDFIDLIDSAINLEEDGIGVSQKGSPMELLARGTSQRFLDLSQKKDTPIWRFNAVAKDGTTAGLNITSGNNPRLFISKVSGFTGISTDSPAASLHVKASTAGDALNIEASSGFSALQIDHKGNVGIGTEPDTTFRFKVNGKVNLAGSVSIQQSLNTKGGINATGAAITAGAGLSVINGASINTGLFEAKGGANISGDTTIISKGAFLSNGSAISDDILNSGVGLSVSDGATIESGAFKVKQGAALSGGLSVKGGLTLQGDSTITSGTLTTSGGISINNHAPFSANGNVTLGIQNETVTKNVTINGPLIATAGATISGEKLVLGNGLDVRGNTSFLDSNAQVTMNGPVTAHNSMTVNASSFIANGSVALGNENDGDATVYGGLTANKGISINGGSFISKVSAELKALQVTNDSELSGNLTVDGDVSIEGDFNVNHAALTANGQVTLGNSSATGTVTSLGTIVGSNGATISGDLIALDDVQLGDTSIESLTVSELSITGNIGLKSLDLSSLNATQAEVGDLEVGGRCEISSDVTLATGSVLATYKGAGTSTPGIITEFKANLNAEAGHYDIEVTNDKIVKISGNDSSDVNNLIDDWKTYKSAHPVLAEGFQLVNDGASSWKIKGQVISLASSGSVYKEFSFIQNVAKIIYSGSAVDTPSLTIVSDTEDKLGSFDFNLSGLSMTITIPKITKTFDLLQDILSVSHSGSVMESPHVTAALNTDATVEVFEFAVSSSHLTINLPQSSDFQSVNQLIIDWTAWKNANVTLAQSFNIDQNGGTGEELVVEISGDLTGDTSTHNVSSLLVNWTRWKDEHRKAAKDFDLEQIGGTGEELVVEVSGNLVANSDLHVMFKGGIYTNTVSVMGFLGFSGSDVEINNLSDSTAFNNADNHTIPTQLAVKSYVDERAYSAGRQNQDFNTADLTVYENFRFDGGHLVNAISNDNTLENSSATAIPTEYAVKSYADTKAEMNGAATEPFATKNLTVHGTFGFFNGHTITTISNSFDASNPSPTTISTEVAVKSYADTKAEMNGAATEPFATENLTVHGSFGFFNGHIIKEISNSFDAANPRQNSLSTEYAVKSFADANLAAREGNSQVDFNTRHLAVAGNFQLGGGAVVSNVTTNITTEENRDGSVPNASAVVAYINEVSTANRSNSTLNYSTNDLTVDGNLKFNDNDLVASKLSNNIETESQPTIAIPTVQAIREYSDTSKAPVNGDAGNDFAANHLQVAGNFTLGSSILNGVSASIDAETNATGTIPTVQAIKEYSDASKAPVNGDAGNDFAAKNLQVAGEFTLGSSILNGVSASIDAETNATGTIPTVQAIREYSDASKAPVNGHADNDFNTNHLHVTGNLTFGSNVLNGVSANIDAETNATGTIPNVQAVKDHVDGKADLKLSPSDGLVVAAGSSAAALSDITSGSSGLIIVRSIITGGVTELGVFAIHGNSAISKVSGDDTSYSLGISGTSLMVSNTASAGITAYITFLGA